MNSKFDELAKGLAQSVTRHGTLKKFGVGLAGIALASLAGSNAIAQPKYSDWSTPLNLGPVINTGYNDQHPAISKDGLSLYFTSNRPGGYGADDLWVSQRTSADEAWGPPQNLGATINTGAALLPSGHTRRLRMGTSNQPRTRS